MEDEKSSQAFCILPPLNALMPSSFFLSAMFSLLPSFSRNFSPPRFPGGTTASSFTAPSSGKEMETVT
eukprot:761252-Hanusia_phi.AAC.1